MRKLLLALILMPALANAEGFYWGANLSQYSPHTEVMFGNLASLENNENVEMVIALVGGYEINNFFNIEATYRTLKGFNYRAVRNPPGNATVTGSYDITLLTIANVWRVSNGLRPQLGIYQHTAGGTVNASSPIFGISSGPKQSSQWGAFYGLGYEWEMQKFSVRADLHYFPVLGDQDVLGAEGDALMLGATFILK